MKRTLALMLVASLVASPAFAIGPEDDKKKARFDADELKAAAVAAAREVVFEELRPLRLDDEVVQTAPGRAGPGWRTFIGLAMLAGGAGIITKGVTSWEDEDRFGRVKNADSYLAFGVGAGIMAFGAIVLKGGLEGRGF